MADPSGKRLANAWVTADGVGSAGKRLRRTGRSARDGTFRLTGFAPGALRVRAGLQGFRNATLQGATPGGSIVQLVLRPRTRR